MNPNSGYKVSLTGAERRSMVKHATGKRFPSERTGRHSFVNASFDDMDTSAKIENRTHFVFVRDLKLRWEVLVDGAVEGDLAPPKRRSLFL